MQEMILETESFTGSRLWKDNSLQMDWLGSVPDIMRFDRKESSRAWTWCPANNAPKGKKAKVSPKTVVQAPSYANS